MKKAVIIVIILLLLCAAGYFYFYGGNDGPTTKPIGQVDERYPVSTQTGVASILLSDGNTVTIDNAPVGVLATDGKVKIIKRAENDIQYVAPQDMPMDTVQVMNTFSTPKGKICKLTLADGTVIWLNTATTLQYPVVFKGKEKKVILRGEGYFEVTGTPRQPFVVKTYREFVKVGTASFNVNCYPDERFVKISFVSGTLPIGGYYLGPSEGFENGMLIKTDVMQDTSWKDGYFDFNNITVEEALLQIARWYDVTIRPDKGVPVSRLKGRIKKDAPLKEVVGMLEGQNVHFRIHGKILYVSPILK